jgi:hypothetical protein
MDGELTLFEYSARMKKGCRQHSRYPVILRMEKTGHERKDRGQ